MGGKIKMYFSKMKLQNFTSYLTFFFFFRKLLKNVLQQNEGKT